MAAESISGEPCETRAESMHLLACVFLFAWMLPIVSGASAQQPTDPVAALAASSQPVLLVSLSPTNAITGAALAVLAPYALLAAERQALGNASSLAGEKTALAEAAAALQHAMSGAQYWVQTVSVPAQFTLWHAERSSLAFSSEFSGAKESKKNGRNGVTAGGNGTQPPPASIRFLDGDSGNSSGIPILVLLGTPTAQVRIIMSCFVEAGQSRQHPGWSACHSGHFTCHHMIHVRLHRMPP